MGGSGDAACNSGFGGCQRQVGLSYGPTELLYALVRLLLYIAISGPFALAAVAMLHHHSDRRVLLILVVSAIWALIVAGCLLFVRLRLILPAVALDCYKGLAETWRLTRGSFWRLVAVTQLAASPFLIFGLFFHRLRFVSLEFSRATLFVVAYTIMQIFGWGAITASAAYAWEFLVKERAEFKN